MDRRDLLKLAGATAAAGWLPRAAWAQPRLAGDPFALGVASGSPTHDSVVLWTRLMGALPPQQVTVRWEVAHDEQFQRIAQRGQQQAMPELAHSVHAEPRGLEPDRWYFYRFIAGGAVSPVGRTRTMPLPDSMPARLRLAYASCQRWEHGHYGAYRHMRAEDLDLVLFLGDYIYEYPSAAGAVRVGGNEWTLTLQEYRDRHALHRGDADLQAMHAACPWLFAWDDHEVQNDYAGLTPGDAGPQVQDFARRRAAAYQAYYEHMPVRPSALGRALGPQPRLHSQQRFGRLANLVMLDNRQDRDPQPCNPRGRLGSASVDPEACPAWDDPRRTMLGTAQEQWLEAVLARGGATWTVFGQQTIFGQRDFKRGEGRSFWNDCWDGYPVARRRLTDSLQRHRVANPVFLGGDVHENWVGHVMADYARPDSAAIGVEFCGTSITSRSGGYARVDEILPENPHYLFGDVDRKGYGVLEITPGRMAAHLRVVDDVAQRDNRIETLASFAVQAGRARVERA